MADQTVADADGLRDAVERDTVGPVAGNELGRGIQDLPPRLLGRSTATFPR